MTPEGWAAADRRGTLRRAKRRRAKRRRAKRRRAKRRRATPRRAFGRLACLRRPEPRRSEPLRRVRLRNLGTAHSHRAQRRVATTAPAPARRGEIRRPERAPRARRRSWVASPRCSSWVRSVAACCCARVCLRRRSRSRSTCPRLARAVKRAPTPCRPKSPRATHPRCFRRPRRARSPPVRPLRRVLPRPRWRRRRQPLRRSRSQA
jgi:hypothetical protein